MLQLTPDLRYCMKLGRCKPFQEGERSSSLMSRAHTHTHTHTHTLQGLETRTYRRTNAGVRTDTHTPVPILIVWMYDKYWLLVHTFVNIQVHISYTAHVCRCMYIYRCVYIGAYVFVSVRIYIHTYMLHSYVIIYMRIINLHNKSALKLTDILRKYLTVFLSRSLVAVFTTPRARQSITATVYCTHCTRCLQ